MDDYEADFDADFAETAGFAYLDKQTAVDLQSGPVQRSDSPTQAQRTRFSDEVQTFGHSSTKFMQEPSVINEAKSSSGVAPLRRSPVKRGAAVASRGRLSNKPVPGSGSRRPPKQASATSPDIPSRASSSSGVRTGTIGGSGHESGANTRSGVGSTPSSPAGKGHNSNSGSNSKRITSNASSPVGKAMEYTTYGNTIPGPGTGVQQGYGIQGAGQGMDGGAAVAAGWQQQPGQAGSARAGGVTSTAIAGQNTVQVNFGSAFHILSSLEPLLAAGRGSAAAGGSGGQGAGADGMGQGAAGGSTVLPSGSGALAIMPNTAAASAAAHGFNELQVILRDAVAREKEWQKKAGAWAERERELVEKAATAREQSSALLGAKDKMIKAMAKKYEGARAEAESFKAQLATAYAGDKLQEVENAKREKEIMINRLLEENKGLAGLNRSLAKKLDEAEAALSKGGLPAKLDALVAELRSEKERGKKLKDELNKANEQLKRAHEQVISLTDGQREMKTKVDALSRALATVAGHGTLASTLSGATGAGIAGDHGGEAGGPGNRMSRTGSRTDYFQQGAMSPSRDGAGSVRSGRTARSNGARSVGAKSTTAKSTTGRSVTGGGGASSSSGPGSRGTAAARGASGPMSNASRSGASVSGPARGSAASVSGRSAVGSGAAAASAARRTGPGSVAGSVASRKTASGPSGPGGTAGRAAGTPGRGGAARGGASTLTSPTRGAAATQGRPPANIGPSASILSSAGASTYLTGSGVSAGGSMVIPSAGAAGFGPSYVPGAYSGHMNGHVAGAMGHGNGMSPALQAELTQLRADLQAALDAKTAVADHAHTMENAVGRLQRQLRDLGVSVRVTYPDPDGPRNGTILPGFAPGAAGGGGPGAAAGALGMAATGVGAAAGIVGGAAAVPMKVIDVPAVDSMSRVKTDKMTVVLPTPVKPQPHQAQPQQQQYGQGQGYGHGGAYGMPQSPPPSHYTQGSGGVSAQSSVYGPPAPITVRPTSIQQYADLHAAAATSGLAQALLQSSSRPASTATPTPVPAAYTTMPLTVLPAGAALGASTGGGSLSSSSSSGSGPEAFVAGQTATPARSAALAFLQANQAGAAGSGAALGVSVPAASSGIVGVGGGYPGAGGSRGHSPAHTSGRSPVPVPYGSQAPACGSSVPSSASYAVVASAPVAKAANTTTTAAAAGGDADSAYGDDFEADGVEAPAPAVAGPTGSAAVSPSATGAGAAGGAGKTTVPQRPKGFDPLLDDEDDDAAFGLPSRAGAVGAKSGGGSGGAGAAAGASFALPLSGARPNAKGSSGLALPLPSMADGGNSDDEANGGYMPSGLSSSAKAGGSGLGSSGKLGSTGLGSVAGGGYAPSGGSSGGGSVGPLAFGQPKVIKPTDLF